MRSPFGRVLETAYSMTRAPPKVVLHHWKLTLLLPLTVRDTPFLSQAGALPGSSMHSEQAEIDEL